MGVGALGIGIDLNANVQAKQVYSFQRRVTDVVAMVPVTEKLKNESGAPTRGPHLLKKLAVRRQCSHKFRHLCVKPLISSFKASVVAPMRVPIDPG